MSEVTTNTMQSMHFSVTLDGEMIVKPLDLLLEILEKDPKNFLRIHISDIIEQYLAALAQLPQKEPEEYAEFLVLAADLMLIKSRMMLPRAEEEEDPRLEMERRLLTHQQKEYATTFLWQQFEDFGGRMPREPEETEIDLEAITRQDLSLLARAFQRLLHRSHEKRELAAVPVRKINTLFKHRVVPVEERVFSVLRYLYGAGETEFEDLLLLADTRSELIASFAAILELVKVQRIRLRIVGGEDTPGEEMKFYFTIDLEHRRKKPGERSADDGISIT